MKKLVSFGGFCFLCLGFCCIFYSLVHSKSPDEFKNGTKNGSKHSIKMSRIGLFVKEAKKWLKLTDPVVFVVGNESCDLDSAVSAVGLAYYYMNATKIPENLLIDGNRRFLPMMNIHRRNLPLKTEVTYFMRKHGINVDDLVCWNEVPRELLDVSKFILVDHHVATPITSNEKTVQIFDHHPYDEKNSRICDDCQLKINEVGSCATLIADEVRRIEKSFVNRDDLISFLRGPIVLDTINFLESADKVRPLDIEINQEIEAALQLKEEDRSKLFKELVKARCDVSSLSALQLLSKDMKIVSDSNKSNFIAIPGFPILVEDFIRKERAWESLEKFGEELNCDIVVLMGMQELKTGGIRRDLGLVILHESNLTEQVVNTLSVESAEYLQLHEKTSELLNSKHIRIFEQQNIKASRKQILPIIQKTLDQDVCS